MATNCFKIGPQHATYSCPFFLARKCYTIKKLSAEEGVFRWLGHDQENFILTYMQIYCAIVAHRHGSCIPLINLVCLVRTVSYGPSFFPRLMTQARSMQAMRRGEKQGSITYSTDQANEVNKIFIIWL